MRSRCRTLGGVLAVTGLLDNPKIKELDLNPVMGYPKGAKTVDIP